MTPWKIFLIIGMTLEFRLLTLNQIHDRKKDMFLSNSNGSLRIQKATVQNIRNFYVVLRARKIFFYTKGNYYGLAYDNDNVKLKLSPVNISKIYHFTQDADLDDKEENTSARSIKVLKWGELVKKKTTECGSKKTDAMNSATNERPIPVVKPVEKMQRPHHIKISRKPLGDDAEEASMRHSYRPDEDIPHHSYPKSSKKKINYQYTPDEPKRRNDENADYRLNQYTPPSIKEDVLPVHKSDKPEKKNEIESDSDILEGSHLNITIKTVNYENKTFVLKNEKNQCVTYFEKVFILAECKKSKRQIFRLVDVDEVIRRISPKKQSLKDDLLDEGNDDSPFDEVINPEQEASRIPDRRVERSPLKIVKSVEERRPLTTVWASYSSVRSAEKDEMQHPEISGKLSAPAYAPAPLSHPYTPRQIQEDKERWCWDLFNRNFGRIGRLPDECKQVIQSQSRMIQKPKNDDSGINRVQIKSTVRPEQRKIEIGVRRGKEVGIGFGNQTNILARLERVLSP